MRDELKKHSTSAKEEEVELEKVEDLLASFASGKPTSTPKTAAARDDNRIVSTATKLQSILKVASKPSSKKTE